MLTTSLLDRDSEGSPILAEERIGRTQSISPEGYLICEDVRIARTGSMLYAPIEIPGLDAGGNRMLVVDRDADCLFAPACIASFNGKPVTMSHPEDMIDTENWQQEKNVGVILNPRQGEGVDKDFLLADLLITVKDAIEAVRKGLRQVSCGYDCNYEQVRPGVGRQVRIIGNHVALVERGRCGPSCAISDSNGAIAMAKSVWTKLRAAFQLGDEKAFDAVLKDAEAGGSDPDDKNPVVHVHVGGSQPEKKEADDEDPVQKLTTSVAGLTDGFAKMGDMFKAHDERFGKIEGTMDGFSKWIKGKDESFGEPGEGEPEAKEKKEGEEKKEETKDSSDLADEWRDTISRAEVLCPGGKSPTFDSKAKRKITSDTLCGYRRDTLIRAKADPKRAAFADKALPHTDIAKASCDAVNIGFLAASEFARIAANGQAFDSSKVAAAAKPGNMNAAKMQDRIKAWRAEQSKQAAS